MQKLGLATLAAVALTCPARADWSFDRSRPAAVLRDPGSDSPVIRITCAGRDQARVQMAYPDGLDSPGRRLKLVLAAQQQQVVLEGQPKRVVFSGDPGGRRIVWNVIGQYGFKSPLLAFLRAGADAQVAAATNLSDGYDLSLSGAAETLDRLEAACRDATLKAERLGKAQTQAAHLEPLAKAQTQAAHLEPKAGTSGQQPAPPPRPEPVPPVPEPVAELPTSAPPLDTAGLAVAALTPPPVADPVATASITPPPEAAPDTHTLAYPCFPDACYGDTFLGTEVIGSDPDGTLVRARLKGWMKVGEGERQLMPEMSTYVYCSKSRPAVLTDTGSDFSPQFVSPGDRSHYDDPVRAVDLYLFFAACHREFQPTYARAVELGLGELRQEGQAPRLPRPEAILTANGPS